MKFKVLQFIYKDLIWRVEDARLNQKQIESIKQSLWLDYMIPIEEIEVKEVEYKF